MKGKIDSEGQLCIERAGVWKVMNCPHQPPRRITMNSPLQRTPVQQGLLLPSCNDVCALFREPVYYNNGKTLQIIQGCSAGDRLEFNAHSFVDERKKQPKNEGNK